MAFKLPSSTFAMQRLFKWLDTTFLVEDFDYMRYGSTQRWEARKERLEKMKDIYQAYDAELYDKALSHLSEGKNLPRCASKH